jgi:hypothetical protein
MEGATAGSCPVRVGDVVWNPLTGEGHDRRVRRGDGGACVVADLAVEAGGFVPGGEHVHETTLPST